MSLVQETTEGRSPSSIDHKPQGAWVFDAAVTRVFDDMLSRSIPQLDEMRRLCASIAKRYAQPKTEIVDLGCSRGGAMKTYLEFCRHKCKCRGVESSESMLREARKELATDIRLGLASVEQIDLRHHYPDVNASVTSAVLTLQFVPIEFRHRIIQRAFDTTVPGGCLIVVEKIVGGSADSQALMVDEYHSLKRENGYTDDAIDLKRESLEGKLVPVTAAWNEDLMASAGWKRVERFWQWMNFAGWLAFKD